VEDGVRVAMQAGATIQSIVDASHKTNELLQDISTGAREQSIGIEQVGRAVQGLDDLTQQNAAMVEETAAAAAAMNDLADTLAIEVARFKLHQDPPLQARETSPPGRSTFYRGCDRPFFRLFSKQKRKDVVQMASSCLANTL